MSTKSKGKGKGKQDIYVFLFATLGASFLVKQGTHSGLKKT